MFRGIKLKFLGRNKLLGTKIYAEPDATAKPEKFYHSAYYSEEVICRDCGKLFIHTAKEKRDFFEIEKGNIYKQFIRCSSCNQFKYAN